jgi:DNA modification methylase
MKQLIKISQVKSNPNNPRLIKNDKFKKLVKSVQDFPEMLELRPIVVDENMIVLGGNMRLKACIEAGLKEVWIEVADLTEQQKKEFTIKDNVGFGEWEWDMLANEWEQTELEDWGLDGFPFEDKTLEAEEDNFEVPDEIKTDIVLGDLFEIGEHRLLCGDSTDSDQVAKLMNGQKADMVFTDPPYGMNLNTNYKNEIKDVGRTKRNYNKLIGDNEDFTPELINTIFACFDYCKEIFIWGADYFAELIPNKNEGSWLVWFKSDGVEHCTLGSEFELCWSKTKHKRKVFNIVGKGFFGHNKKLDGDKREHPTQKSVKLIIEMLELYSRDKYLIADLFLGSGSTMVASHQLKRKCYGMELDPKYCQVIIDRMKKLDPNLVIKRNGINIE